MQSHRVLAFVLLSFFMFAVAGMPAYAEDWRANLPTPLADEDYHDFSMEQAKIGRLLFFDKILSGNRNIACATCHHPRFGTSDGLSLGIGEGGSGVGPDRIGGVGRDKIKKRIPRNASALWNLGAKDFTVLFHDGRLSVGEDFGNGFNTPAEEWLPEGFNTALATQAIFPLTSQFEMAGNPGENEVVGAAHDRIDNVWPILAKRVRIIPEYADMFIAAFDDVDAATDITIAHIGEALAAFIGIEFESRDSVLDAYLAGDEAAMDGAARRGMEIFYGKGGCSGCHAGALLTDQKFHALAIPPFGPGRTRRFDPYTRDVGRMGESDKIEDAYRFRTPSLRNVALTAPYGHNGAFPDLEAVIRHHLDPATSLANWRRSDANLPALPWLAAIDFVVWEDRIEMARYKNKTDIAPVELHDGEVADLVAFMHSLTGDAAGRGEFRFGIPESVPSGLGVDK